MKLAGDDETYICLLPALDSELPPIYVSTRAVGRPSYTVYIAYVGSTRRFLSSLRYDPALNGYTTAVDPLGYVA
jgi:hypothetical protein